ncbi:peptidoglycan/xylan/chitin deacetylase (PgdA/CDA1 family) [Micromonospora pisi]|uniref:Peptidoglycan/xylan/chitin deacetylase (PgdA/CDA1 family) n=1 Tax=Micromonospora pisi TaxID=589240 RepID=A0A495JKC1_9ACTN|nr:polysaccharide deacetylase family protein [Micromonospora pisi]RKR89028.1 peptidoglycan/xylan/chitin deacetylase (PgdA/CDA1 family) [Micromonospora pisi]
MTRPAALAAGLVLVALLATACGPDQHDQAARPQFSPFTPATSEPAPTTAPTATPTPPPADPTPSRPPAPRSTVGPLDTRRTTGSRGVALTFDDGPSPDWTPKVLDQLRKAQVKATFCVVGVKVRKYPRLVARIVREGHTLCNHSWQHDLELGGRPPAEIRADLSRTNREIRRAVPGARIGYYRQPGGKWTPSVVQVSRELGMVPLHWDVDPRDWDKPGAAAISKRVLAQARPGSIILLHDGGGDRSGTLTACPGLFGALKQKYGIARLK